MARIERGRKVMGDRKGEWHQMDELPVRSEASIRNADDHFFFQIEILLPSENRYHSIFTCLVSKEQSTESNPPMMMTCGHVISKDSLQKLNKSGGQVDIILRSCHGSSPRFIARRRSKCPYCPVETQLGSALRMWL